MEIVAMRWKQLTVLAALLEGIGVQGELEDGFLEGAKEGRLDDYRHRPGRGLRHVDEDCVVEEDQPSVKGDAVLQGTTRSISLH